MINSLIGLLSFIKVVTVALKCNGYFSKYFPVLNSVKQGCPIRTLLYSRCTQSLSRIILHNTNIEGICIPQSIKPCVLFQYADDTTFSVKNESSIREIFKVFKLYEEGSGARINESKTEMLCSSNTVLSDGFKKYFSLIECISYQNSWCISWYRYERMHDLDLVPPYYIADRYRSRIP